MSAFLFGTCGCCLGGVLSGGDYMRIQANVPYNFGWVYGVSGTPVSFSLHTHPYRGVPPTIYRTLQGGGVSHTYSIWGKLTSGAGDSGENKLSDPYPYSEAVANAIALMRKVTFGGNFPAQLDGKPVRLCYAADAEPGEVNVQQVTVTADEDGKLIFDGGFVGGYLAAYGWMPTEPAYEGGQQYTGQVWVAQSMIRSPYPFRSMHKQWFEFERDPNDTSGPNVSNSALVPDVPIDIAAGESVWIPTDAPARGFISVSTALAKALGS